MVDLEILSWVVAVFERLGFETGIDLYKILDAADIAMTLEPHNDEGAISMETTKIRGDKAMKFTSGMNWDTLRISPIPVDKPESKKETKDGIKRAGKKDDESTPTGEQAKDTPW